MSRFYSRVLGLAMLAPVFIYLFASVVRLPREQQARIIAQIEKQEQSTVGRLLRFAGIGLWLLIAYALLAWLYERWQYSP